MQNDLSSIDGQGLLGKMAGGIGGLFTSAKDAAKDKAKAAKKGIMAILQGTLVAGFALAAVAFLNSKYWDQTKKVLIDDVLPALVNALYPFPLPI